MVRGMLALMSGLGNGYNQGRQQEFENERRTKLDQIALDRAARETKEFDQQQADRTELRDAAALVQAAPDMVPTPDGSPVQRMLLDPSGDNRDAGEAGTAPALPAQRVGMQGMLSPQQAGAMVAQSNLPDAVRARQVSVLQRQSPEKAAVLQAHDLSLKNTQMDMANKEADAQANAMAMRGPEALVNWTSESGMSGKKWKWVPTEDQAFGVIHEVLPDGTTKPTGLKVENNLQGALKLAEAFSKSTPTSVKLKHFLDERIEARKGRVDEANINESNAKADYYRGVNVAKPAKGVIDRMRESDKMTFADINKQRENIAAAITKAQAEGMWDDKAPGSQQLATRLTALNMRATALVAKYEKEGGGAPDPLGVRMPDPYGLRGASVGATKSTTTTRAPTSMEIVQQDMKRNGFTSATATLDGNPKIQIGTPAPAAPSDDAGFAAIGRMQDVAAAQNLEVAGQRLDDARVAADTANSALQRFGSRQRLADQKGFRAASAAAQAAKQRQDEAEAAYAAIAAQGPASTRPAFRYASP